jgi:hypothetical protein
MRLKIGLKISPKTMKIKTLQHEEGDDSIQKHGYIDVNQEFIRCENHTNILPLFGRLGRSLTPLLSSIRHKVQPHLAKQKYKAKGVGEGYLL